MLLSTLTYNFAVIMPPKHSVETKERLQTLSLSSKSLLTNVFNLHPKLNYLKKCIWRYCHLKVITWNWATLGAATAKSMSWSTNWPHCISMCECSRSGVTWSKSFIYENFKALLPLPRKGFRSIPAEHWAFCTHSTNVPNSNLNSAELIKFW